MSREAVPAISAEDVIQIQQRIGENEEKISAINQVIATEQVVPSHENAANQTIADLSRERDDYLAAKAMGESIDDTRLDLVEKQLKELLAAEAESTQEQLARLDHAERVVAGLRRKLSPIEQDLRDLEEGHRNQYLNYLYTQAEKEGQEYKKLASSLIKKAMRIIALGKIIEHCPWEKCLPIYSEHNERFLIPGFDLDACRGTIDGDPWRLEKVDPNTFLDAVVAMIDEIKRTGIQIPV